MPHRRAPSQLCMSSAPHADIAVRLDTPLISPSTFKRPTTLAALKCFSSIVISDMVKIAIVAFVLALSMSVLSRVKSGVPVSSLPGGEKLKALLDAVSFPFRKAAAAVAYWYRWARSHMLLAADRVASGGVAAAATGPAVPMKFDGEGGWGVCTLQSKESVGRSSYMKYEFTLPRNDNVLPLSLGQQITMCCLDNDDSVVQGDFFPYSPRKERGKVSILLPEGSDAEENAALLGSATSNFARALATDIIEGDEVAIKPGKCHLEYRGQYLPVNEMIFLAHGMGIAPVVEEVRAVLPNGSSSVELASVVWFDENVRNFDIAEKQLESEYKKYPSKLAVTCIDGDLTKDNPDVEDSVPNFSQGIMAVVSGPASFAQKAKRYLVERGYPKDCVCVLP